MKLLIFSLCVVAAFCWDQPPADDCGCCPEPCCCICVDVETKGTTTPTPTTTPVITTPTTPFIPVCNVTQDIIFIMDTSGSISDSDFEVEKGFLLDVVRQMGEIGDAGTRVGVVSYGSNVEIAWQLNDPETSSFANLESAIMNNIPFDGMLTHTVEAMETAALQMLVPEQLRPGVPVIAIVLTDGKGNHRTAETESISNLLQSKTDTVIAIGVSSQADETELQTIASGDGDDNVFMVDEFDKLQDILASLVSVACTEPPIIPTKPPTTTTPPPPPATPPTIITKECFCCCPPPPGSYWNHHVVPKFDCC
eukprot:TRINITY_DN33664_c0_g1_i1.p1 TRINITY_DN33664_c0_g1~~TRINITY_DN33664_c0_g1_i1.p1  ORF type:complete len:309 (+),score=31.76 TRINITY_DN33664_c0_g1_i1:15-941(+)